MTALARGSRVPVSRPVVGGAVAILAGVLMIAEFGVNLRSGAHTQFGFSLIGAKVRVPVLRFPARGVSIVLGVVVAAIGAAFAAGLRMPRRVRQLAVALVIVLFVASFLIWSSASKSSVLNITDLGQQTVIRSIPLVLGAMAGILGERSGVVNIAIEGQMLLGAFTGAIVGSAVGSIWLGLVGAALAGALLGGMLAFLAIRYLVDQVIIGVVLNVLALGLTNFLYDRVLVPKQNSLNSPSTFPDIHVPVLTDIPIVGPILFADNAFLYITYGVLILLHVTLFHTRAGLRVRAVGEHPAAADTVGIRVRGTRYTAVLIGGLIAGIAGASFTLGSVGAFGKNITSGKGYIALAAVIFGGWRPVGALAAALLFGFADALQSELGVIGSPIPQDFLSMLPYLATIAVVAGLIGRVRAPAADGTPYVKS